MALAILTYKPEQGRYARGVSFGLLVLLAFYGAWTLRNFLSWDWARKDLGFTVPVLEVVVTPGVVIATVVFLAALIGLRLLMNQPRLAELLIDTEGELRRVTWPSWPDTWNGSMVVVVTVLVLVALIAGFDFVLTQVFETVVFG